MKMANGENEKFELLDDGDSEALALSLNPEFMTLLDKACARYEAKGGKAAL